MAKFTPSFSGVKGRALFSLLFAAPMIHATDTVTTKDGETITVTADANTATDATDGYQPLSTSTATLTDMPMLDIPQVVNTVSDQVLENQHATTLDEALYNVSNVVQTNTLGGTQDAFVRRGFGANRWLHHDQRPANRTSSQFQRRNRTCGSAKRPGLHAVWHSRSGGLINVVTKRPEKTFHGSVSATSSSFGGGTGQLDITGPIEGTQLAYRLTGKCRMKTTGGTSVKSAVHLLPHHSPGLVIMQQ